jgi:hypothetical protein
MFLAVACCSPAMGQAISSVQASVIGGTAAAVTSITIGTQPGGFTLYVNGTFDLAANPHVQWDDNTNGVHSDLLLLGSSTNTQLVCSVSGPLYFALNPATVNITAFQGINPSNIVNFFIVPQPTTVGSFPNAFVGSPYGPVAAIQNGTAPFSFSAPSGNLPPGISLNTNGQLTTATVVGAPPGPYTFQSKVNDFWGATTPLGLTITIQSIGTPTVSAVTSSAGNSYGYGTLTGLTATIGPASANPPFAPNTVQFLDGAKVLGTVSVVPATGLASLPNVLLNIGPHSILAKFIGDTNWQAVVGAASTITVTAGPPNITVTGSPFVANYGGTLSAGSITVAGAPGAAVPTGNLTITVGPAVITTFSNINPSSVVTANSLTGLQLPASIAAGANTLSYTYTGDGNYAPRTGSVTLTVDQAIPSVTIAVATNPTTYGQSESLTASVKPPGLGTPTGTVTFFDGSTAISSPQTVPVSGVVTFSISTLTPGAHSPNVTYSGDTNFLGSESSISSLTVNPAAPNITFTGAPFSASYGGTLSAGSITVAGAGGPAAAPSGTLVISVASVPITTVTTLNPGGTVTANSLTGLQLPAAASAGTQSVSYNYSGDGNYTAQTGNATLVINRAQPSVTLAVARNPILTGQTETLTGSVKPPGAGTPSGTVTFLDGTAPLPDGTFTLSTSGSATLSTATLSLGLHTLSVSYSGDTNFLPTQSAGSGVTVNSAALTFVTTFLPGGVALQPYSVPINVVGGAGGYTFSASGLPSGLNINPQTGTIGGAPTTVGTFSVVITVVDSAGARISQTLPLSIAAPSLRISTSSPLPNGTVGIGYSATIGVVGGTAPFTFTASGTLPPGLTFVSNGPFVTGTPTTAGTYTFTVKVVDTNGATDLRDFSITVKPAPLAIPGGPTNPTGTAGVPLSINFGCTGGAPPYTYSVTGSLPQGVTFANCTLSGTPAAPGTFLIHILITDSAGTSVTRDVTITIAPPGLALPGGPLPDGQVGVQYKATVSAAGGVPPITYSGSGLPDGLTLASNGDITGTPTTAGLFSFRVTAKDSSVATAPVTVTATYSIKVAPPTLALGPATLPDGVVGLPYSGSLTATGGVKPYNFTASGLPDGLILGTDGAISGTALAAGSFSVNATVTDAANASVKQTYTITIAPRPSLAIQPAAAPNGTVGSPYSVTFTATGGTAPYTFSAIGQPSTLTMSPAGTLAGTPAAPGSFTIVVTVKDANGTTGTKSYPVTISLPASPPLNFAGINTTVNALQQPRVSVSLASPYPVDVLVTLTLAFQADSGPADPSVAFSTGGTTTTINIPAGSLNGATDVGIQTGTVAGTITITAKLTAAGADVTPSPAPTRTSRIAAGAPVIISATGTRTSSGLTITVIGYVTDREMVNAAYGFNGSNLGTSTLTVTVDTLFAGWLGGNAPPSAPFGSQFTYTQQFTVNGSNTAITSVTVTLNNRIGASNTATVTLQ